MARESSLGLGGVAGGAGAGLTGCLLSADLGRPGRVRGLVVIVAAGLLAGCNGGTVDRHALTNDSATLDSMACEGALLAHEVARGKTTSFYAREQAEELRIQSSNLADALARRPTLASIEQKVRTKAKEASHLSAILQRLHDHPGDRRVASTLEQQLKRVGGCK